MLNYEYIENKCLWMEKYNIDIKNFFKYISFNQSFNFFNY